MIDTVILSIPEKSFSHIDDPNTAPWALHSVIGNYRKLVKNQTAKQKGDGVYRPRIRINERGREKSLQIEFSVPKLIYSNNLDEVCERDFEMIIQTLQTRLMDFAVMVSHATLRNASVSVFHPSKNILLSDGYTAQGVIKELQKSNLTKRMDLDKSNYRNVGESMQCYTASHSLVIYDKIPDLKKPSKRAIDKDQTPVQGFLFGQLSGLQKQTEVLRIEVRITNKRKMNALLSKHGFPQHPSFQDIFREDLCLTFVYAYWNDLIIQPNLFLFSLANKPKQMLKNLIKAYPDIKPKEIAYLIGLDVLAKDEDGIRELRGYLEKQGSERTWSRISKSIQKLNKAQNPLHCHNWIRQAESQIKDYKPLKINDLICKEL